MSILYILLYIIKAAISRIAGMLYIFTTSYPEFSTAFVHKMKGKKTSKFFKKIC